MSKSARLVIMLIFCIVVISISIGLYVWSRRVRENMGTSPVPSTSTPPITANASASAPVLLSSCTVNTPADQINAQTACTNVQANNVDAQRLHGYLTKLQAMQNQLQPILASCQNIQLMTTVKPGDANVP